MGIKRSVILMVIAGLLVFGWWVAIIYLVLHFVLKFW